MAEILPGIHQILVNYNGRPLKLYLLCGKEASMLVDVGDMPVPERDIEPYMRSIDMDVESLDYVLITHPDVDHCAGLANMRRLAPRARVVCGEADRRQVESPEALVDERAGMHLRDDGVGPVGEAREKLLARAGSYAPVDIGFTGGESIRLGAPLGVVRIMHLPGHSWGHLGVYVEAYQTGIIGDAVHDKYSPDLQGVPALPVTYMFVEAYVKTIIKLQGMAESGALERLYSAHWPDQVGGEAVKSWLTLSREYAIYAERVILNLVRKSPDGLTLRDLLTLAKPDLGTWPASRDESAHYFMGGHLERLVSHGLLDATDTHPRRYFWNREQ